MESVNSFLENKVRYVHVARVQIMLICSVKAWLHGRFAFSLFRFMIFRFFVLSLFDFSFYRFIASIFRFFVSNFRFFGLSRPAFGLPCDELVRANAEYRAPRTASGSQRSVTGSCAQTWNARRQDEEIWLTRQPPLSAGTAALSTASS